MALEAQGSNPCIHLHRTDVSFMQDFGLSPSGKAQDFDSCITLVRIQLAQDGILAQSVEHLTFNQGVAGSNPACLTILYLRSR